MNMVTWLTSLKQKQKYIEHENEHGNMINKFKTETEVYKTGK